jgi:Bacterial CdiA-CT RNAse A domain
MTRSFRARAVLVSALFPLALCALISCQSPPSTTAATAAPSTAANTSHGPVRNLSPDEVAGGHILRKHVGQTDDQLRERLEQERRISGASTYTDRSSAEHAVGAAIAASEDRIERWLNRPGGHPNLVLDYDSPTPVGRTINRGESQPHPCAHALVVLKYAGPHDYYVLTSYPECRS